MVSSTLLTAEQIARVEVRVNRVAPDVLRHGRSSAALERKVSMPYCPTVALVRGGVELGHFGKGPVDDDVRGLMERVTMLVDPTMPDAPEQHAWSRVTVMLTDGRVLASRSAAPTATPIGRSPPPRSATSSSPACGPYSRATRRRQSPIRLVASGTSQTSAR